MKKEEEILQQQAYAMKKKFKFTFAFLLIMTFLMKYDESIHVQVAFVTI
jgi:hypothetical protein